MNAENWPKSVENLKLKIFLFFNFSQQLVVTKFVLLLLHLFARWQILFLATIQYYFDIKNYHLNNFSMSR